jgi:uncharacterized SAM-binding protein YcdF (DUF218 family)
MASDGPMTLSPLVKAALTPGSIAFAVLCLVIWIVLRFVWPGAGSPASRYWLAAVAVLYVVLALPVVATRIAGSLPVVAQADLVEGTRINTLVVLDGDNRVGRVREGLRVYRAVSPPSVVVLGGSWVLKELADGGIPRERLTIEAGPAITRDQIDWLGRQLASKQAGRIVVVASRLQMPRVAGLSRAGGLDVKLVSSPIDIEPPTSGIWRFVPTYVALRASRDSLYEHAALAYYRWRGWID